MAFVNILLDVFVVSSILIICIIAYKKQSLTITGAAFAFILTLGLYISGGIPFLAALLGFFLSSSFFTKLKTLEKEELEKALYEKGGTRDHIQVLANCGAAFIFATAYYFVPDTKLIIIYFTAIAACNADSWASEIGTLGGKTPFSIITLKPVQKGMSGGVSLLGLFASACGAGFIAGIYFIFMFFKMPFLQLIVNCVIIGVFGFAGALFDSILGAVIQPAYIDNKSGRLTERRVTHGVCNRKVKGYRFFSNDMVNFASSLIAACLAYAVV